MMSRSTIAFYGIAGVLFAMFSAMWFKEGDLLFGGLAGAIALWDLFRMGVGIGSRKGAGGGAEATRDPFGVPGADSVTVRIRVTGEDKIASIRALREAVPGLGLKDGKDMVEEAMERGSAVLTRAATPEQAARIRESLAAAGAGVEVVGEDEEGR